MHTQRLFTALLVALVGLAAALPSHAASRKSPEQKALEKALRYEAKAHSADAAEAVGAPLKSGFLQGLLAKADEVRGQQIQVDPRVLATVDRFFAAEGRTPEAECMDDGGCSAYRVKKVFVEGENDGPEAPIKPIWRVIAEHQEDPDPEMAMQGYQEVWVFRALTVDPEAGTVEQWWGR